jgi:hypothetical protein
MGAPIGAVQGVRGREQRRLVRAGLEDKIAGGFTMAAVRVTPRRPAIFSKARPNEIDMIPHSFGLLPAA